MQLCKVSLKLYIIRLKGGKYQKCLGVERNSDSGNKGTGRIQEILVEKMAGHT